MPSELLAVVGIPLDNPSALSSIRGIYGGLHIAFGAMMLWSLLKNPSVALLFVVIYTGGFTLGRWTAFALDGQPNAFVTTWMFVEPVCGLVSWFLWSRLQQKSTAPRVNMA